MADYSFNNVLIIDDSEIDVLVNRRLMELTHFAKQIVVTGSGEQALHFLAEECASGKNIPEWIFLDMHLPIMSGFDFIEQFKSLPEEITHVSKIIILSVFQKQERLQQALENSFVAGSLEKPLTREALISLARNKRIIVDASS